MENKVAMFERTRATEAKVVESTAIRVAANTIMEEANSLGRTASATWCVTSAEVMDIRQCIARPEPKSRIFTNTSPD